MTALIWAMAIPGSLVALALSYWYGARRERLRDAPLGLGSPPAQDAVENACDEARAGSTMGA